MYEITGKGGLFRAMDISASGLTAQRKKINAIASNMANVETTRGEDGKVYRRQRAVFTSEKSKSGFTGAMERAKIDLKGTRPEHFGAPDAYKTGSGGAEKVNAEIVLADESSVQIVYDPDHPDADEKGYVSMPDINPLVEMVDLMTATRLYEANVTVLNSAKSMILRALDI